MFTGIIEEVGTVRAVTRRPPGAALTVGCAAVLDGTRVGDSVSVDGCCLTVTGLDQRGFTVEAMGETLARTGIGDLAIGDGVNLERAVRAGDRLGGHLVQGHVDGVGTLTAVEPHDDWTTLRVLLPDGLARYVAEKGSIAVDGVSLTVTEVGASAFAVGLIPHTLAVTALGRRRVGDRLNLEVDVIAKYVERLLAGGT